MISHKSRQSHTDKFSKIAQKPEQSQQNFYRGRFILCYLIIGLLAFALCYKVFSLQLDPVQASKLMNKADNFSIRNIKLPYTRAKLLDRSGKILSVSVPLYIVTIDPRNYFSQRLERSNLYWKSLAKDTGRSASQIKGNVTEFIEKAKKKYNARYVLNPKDDGYWDLLSELTGIERKELIDEVRDNPSSSFMELEHDRHNREQQKFKALADILKLDYKELMETMYKSSTRADVRLALDQSELTAEYIKALKIKEITLVEQFRRFYPMAEETAQLIGFTDISESTKGARESQNVKGKSGLEKSFDSLLSGKDGNLKIRKDNNDNVIEHIEEKKPYDPVDVMLSIDSELQSITYREVKKAVVENNAESGTAVLLDIHTGEILAMASAPSYNPNNRSGYKNELARNLAISNIFEPGSTVKPLVVLTALQHKVTYADEVINTRPFTVNGHTITDVSPRESLTLTGILQKSSNVGVSRLALRMPPSALVETYSKVGFGKDTGLGLGERTGLNGDRQQWSDIARANLAYGYGLNVTPLQLARAYATLGSFGIYRPLSITKVDPPVIGERVLPEKITRDVVRMMESVAQKGEGGQRAAVNGYRVAVKTGTVRTVSEKGGYNSDRHISYTAGIAPASDPRFSLVVIINEPKAGNYYGGSVAAPIFSNIMGYTLKSKNIKPDNLTE